MKLEYHLNMTLLKKYQLILSVLWALQLHFTVYCILPHISCIVGISTISHYRCAIYVVYCFNSYHNMFCVVLALLLYLQCIVMCHIHTYICIFCAVGTVTIYVCIYLSCVLPQKLQWALSIHVCYVLSMLQKFFLCSGHCWYVLLYIVTYLLCCGQCYFILLYCYMCYVLLPTAILLFFVAEALLHGVVL